MRESEAPHLPHDHRDVFGKRVSFCRLAQPDAGSDRNKTAIKKTASGLLKLLLPNAATEPPDPRDFETVLGLAAAGPRDI